MSAPAPKIRRRPELLVAKGFSGLTLRAIAEESGENSAMVQYYFGNKEGLVKAMIDSVFRDDQEDAAAAMSAAGSEDRLHRFVDGLRTISSSRSFRVFFDMLPTPCASRASAPAWRAPTTRTGRLKRDWLRRSGRPSPCEQKRRCSRVAELATAVVDGLAIQELIDDDFDRERAYAVLEFMLQRSLPELLESGLPGAAAKR